MDFFEYHNIISFTKDSSWKTGYFQLSGYETSRLNAEYEAELYLNKSIPHEDSVRCMRCGSDNIQLIEIGGRAMDESQPVSATCNNCGNRFVPK